MTQLPALLWKNTYNGTVAWNYKNMKCRWAITQSAGDGFICVLSGRTPAEGIHNRLFKALKKIDKNVVLLNDYSDTNTRCVGTRILYREYEVDERITKEEVNSIKSKNDSEYFHDLTDTMKALKYKAEIKLYEWKIIHQDQGDDDDNNNQV
jgi:hypothetical protein